MGLRPALAIAVLAVASAAPARASSALAQASGTAAPRVMLWAWEWPQDLRFLAGRASVGTAFLAATVRVDGQGARSWPRRQPLWVPPGLYVAAVVRVEVAGRHRIDDLARAAIVQAFVDAARRPNVRAVQSDFDAPASLREDYRALLVAIRRALPAGVGLSMTALGSWCTHDDWLDQVVGQVDEIVPMLFSMGPGGRDVWRWIAADGDVRSRHCRSSVGLATYEDHPRLPAGRRLFLFHRGPWDAAAFERVMARESQKESQ